MSFVRTMQRRRGGLVVGCAVTVLGCAAFAAGLFQRLDAYGLDLHFRYFSTIKADPRIVMIDINDHALQSVGDWPWPRRRYAQIVDTLHELGAGAIVLDLVLSEPVPPRRQHADLGAHYDVDTLLPAGGERSADPIIFDDDELRDAMARAGNVYLAMFFRLSPPALDPHAVLDHARAMVRRERPVAPTPFERQLLATFPSVSGTFDLEALYRQVRIASALEEDFGLDARAVAERLTVVVPVGRAAVETHLPGVKRLVARRAAERFLHDDPAGDLAEFLAFVLGPGAHDALTADRDTLIRAYRWAQAFRVVASSLAPAAPPLNGHIVHAYDLTLPLEKLARMAKGVGFVSFERERQGGVVREIPLLADAGGVLVPQLGLLAAIDALGMDRSAVAYEGGRLTLGRGADARHLRIDDTGSTLLSWHVPDGRRPWSSSFDHIPVTRVLEVSMNAEAVAENETRRGLATAGLVELRHADTPSVYADYVQLVNRRLALHTQRNGTSDAQADARRASDIDAAIQQIEDEAIVWLQRAHHLWESEDPQTDEERAQRNRIGRLYASFGEGQLAGRLAAANERLAERSNALRAELRPRIAGKICFVGYTASGVADLVTSPVFSSMPGVMAHANIANMVLQNQPAVRAPLWVNMLVLLAGGALITVVTCVRGPFTSLVVLGNLFFVILGCGAVAFLTATCHVSSLVVVGNMAAAWGCVTVYRQFVEERTRRHMQRALAQYTSPAVATRITSGVPTVDLTPQPARVTCFFSDLYGFTSLSERLGARRTRMVLNPYLQAMSRVLVEHGAIINKFMGDGIFAFFNAPIWPCRDHPAAACACAAASWEALNELNRGRGPTDGDDARLSMRIGLSTGEAFVGDYGSDMKLDYTCIGDTVNLAARLERANKILGTRVLVDEATRREAGDRFTFRSLGRIQVPGKTQTVEAHELVGSRERIDPSTLDYISRFQEAVRYYQARDWDPCTACLDACQAIQPNDGAVRLYRQAVTQHRESPPGPDWNRAIVLPT